MTTTQTRPLHEIAQEIRADWTKPNHAARPYLDALDTMINVSDRYFYDDGKSIVLYFLGNAGTWKGDTARRIKAELKGMIKS